MNIYTTTITLFLVMNPLGNIPTFIATLKHVSPKRKTKIIFREAIFAFFILCIFLFGGHQILRGLQISEPALGIAGGILLFIIALRLIFPGHLEENGRHRTNEPILVPLAIPLFAGPATMTTLMLLVDQQPHDILGVFLAMLIAWLISSSLLLLSMQISKLLGQHGLAAVEKLMGMVLTAIAVQMLLSGINTYFNLATK